MRPTPYIVLALLALTGCNTGQGNSATQNGQPVSLVEARKGFQTRLVRQQSGLESLPKPPPRLFRAVSYQSPAGRMAAYLSPDPKDGKKHPAILWITGGDCNSIGDVWNHAPPSNDQTASAFRKAGILMMYPSLRGGNTNPGVKESFLGEVDDVLAAAATLAQISYVDPARIYLGGHSTGGTLVLLVAECSDRFRAIFSFGPVGDVRGYGSEYCPFDRSNPKEADLRSPGPWLGCIKNPIFVIEGTYQGNYNELYSMSRSTRNPNIHFLPVRGANHFNVLFPSTRLIANKILQDDGPECNLTLTEDELHKAFAR